MRTMIYPCILALAGCASTYTHPTSGEAQFYSDRAECQAEAANLYPPMPVAQAQVYTTCTGYGASYRCTSTGGGPASLDFSGLARAGHLHSCLMGRGWRLE